MAIIVRRLKKGSRGVLTYSNRQAYDGGLWREVIGLSEQCRQTMIQEAMCALEFAAAGLVSGEKLRTVECRWFAAGVIAGLEACYEVGTAVVLRGLLYEV